MSRYLLTLLLLTVPSLGVGETAKHAESARSATFHDISESWTYGIVSRSIGPVLIENEKGFKKLAIPGEIIHNNSTVFVPVGGNAIITTIYGAKLTLKCNTAFHTDFHSVLYSGEVLVDASGARRDFNIATTSSWSVVAKGSVAVARHISKLNRSELATLYGRSYFGNRYAKEKDKLRLPLDGGYFSYISTSDKIVHFGKMEKIPSSAGKLFAKNFPGYRHRISNWLVQRKIASAEHKQTLKKLPERPVKRKMYSAIVKPEKKIDNLYRKKVYGLLMKKKNKKKAKKNKTFELIDPKTGHQIDVVSQKDSKKADDSRRELIRKLSSI